MTIKEINTKFSLNKYKHNGKYLLFGADGSGKRMVNKYLCQLERKGQSFNVPGFKGTTKLNVLEKQVEQYVKSLPYDSEYYLPLYRKGLFVEYIIHDYLVSLGFKSHGDSFYELQDKNVYGYKSHPIKISFNNLDEENIWVKGKNGKEGKFISKIHKEVTLILWTGPYSWVESKCKRDVEDIKKAIDSILKPLFLTDSAVNFKKSEELKNAGDVNVIMKALTENMNIMSADYKQTLKEKLLELSNKL